MTTLGRHAEITAVLADDRFDVLAAPPAPHGLAWLRASVSRFSRGDAHARRRELAVAALAAVAPADLRAAARALAADPGVIPHEVPVSVLAAALGATRPVVAAVVTVTPGYFGGVNSGDSGGSDLDDAVAELVAAFGGAATEETAARIGLLLQTHDATARLVISGLARSPRSSLAPLTAVLLESLRHDPPVAVMRRECLVDHERRGPGLVPAGTVTILDVAAANRDPAVFADPDRFDPTRPGLDRVLTFGSGPRACPGRDHALALAAGTVEGVLGLG
jgi:cytochrome P450